MSPPRDITQETPLKSMKKYFCIFSCSLLLLLLGRRMRETRDFKAIQLSNAHWQGPSKNVTVLLWHRPFGQPSPLWGDVCWDLYRVPRCRLVEERSFYNVADVVVFHNRELRGIQKLPLHLPRPPGQRWVWMTLESHAHNGDLRPFADIFNLTMSFRRDADISIPYGELLPREDGEDEPGVRDEAPGNKTVLVCWVISNYQSAHRRSHVFKELSASIPVMVYGRWVGRPLSPEALLPTISRCYFYLAFENSLAKDYITEKLWRNAYLSGAVPVVLGPQLSDYKAVAPPNSFIHVDDFGSEADLADYLKRLASNKRLYTRYLEWRRRWRVKLITDWRERLCRVCSQYDSLPPHKVYSDLQAWVTASEL